MSLVAQHKKTKSLHTVCLEVKDGAGATWFVFLRTPGLFPAEDYWLLNTPYQEWRDVTDQVDVSQCARLTDADPIRLTLPSDEAVYRLRKTHGDEVNPCDTVLKVERLVEA